MIVNNKYCILDCETGGFSAEKHALTEIGFIIVDKDLEEIERHSFLIKPYDPKLEYSPQALKVTGLTMDILNSKGLDARSVAESVQEIFARNSKGVKEKLVLVGHNFQFDYGFMDQFFKRFDLQIGKYTDDTYQCTLWLSRMAWGYDDSMTDFKLATCCERAGVDMGDAHRAGADVDATLGLFRYHIRSLRGAAGSAPMESESSGEFVRKHSFKF